MKIFDYFYIKKIMGWGIIIPQIDFVFQRKFRLTDIYLNRITKDDLESKLEESNEMISWYKEQLIALGANSAATIRSEDGDYDENIIDFSVRRVNNIFDELKSEVIQNYLIQRALEQYDTIISD